MQLNLTLGVVALEKTERFYREILCLSPEYLQTDEGQRVCLMIPCGGVKLMFQPLPEMERQHPAVLQNLTRSPLGVGVQLEFSCESLDEIYRRVKHYRWSIVYELEDREHRRRELWLHDPDGYLLVLNQD